MNTNTTSNKNRAIKAMRFTTPLALLLAAGLTGCQSTQTLSQSSNDQFTTEGKAQLANVSLDDNFTFGEFTSEDYTTDATGHQLPQQWLSEARSSTAEIQAQRANAQAFEVQAQSDFHEGMAFADVQLQEAVTDRDTGYAEARRTQSVHNARINQMNRQIEARGVESDAKWERQEAFLSASVKEWQAEIERIRTESETEWSSALAEHDRMMTTYAMVRDRGQAEIDQMNQTVDLTEERASAKVQSLRTQAQSVAQQSAAEVFELNQKISTITEQTQARFDELTQQAKSLDANLSSEVELLIAQANQFEAADVDANYSLDVEAAQTAYESSLAEADNLRLSADERSTQDRAHSSRMMADANASLASAQTTFDEAQKWISSQYSKSMADISNTLAQAEREEQIARSGFVKAEIEARVEALHKQADHDRALAETELKKIEAESLAHASAMAAKFTKEFAEQARKGSFVIPSNTQEPKSTVSSSDETPSLAKAETKPVNVKADRVASFKSGLAKASQLRQKADADRLDAIAHRDAEMGKFNDWWTGKQADFQATVASIEAFEQKSNADVSRLLAQSDSLIASAETERTRALVDAESSRTEVLAKIETLRGNSVTLTKKKSAQVKQLLAQADATKRIGESQVAAATVQRDAAARRGEAKSAQLLAEAASLEQSQRAVVAQLRSEIEASSQILEAELARLNQSAQSFIAVAESNFNEGVAMADAFERIAVANTTELTARHIASRKQSNADIEYLQYLANASELKRDAEVTRMYAQADEQLGFQHAQDIATRSEIEAQQQIAMASAAREFSVADARDASVRAQFNYRVAMTQSDRNNAYADVYAQAQQQLARTEIAAAQAATYSELSQAALSRLNTAAQSFQLTAQRNWDSRLAMPASFTQPVSTQELIEGSQNTFDFGEFTSVPTDSE